MLTRKKLEKKTLKIIKLAEKSPNYQSIKPEIEALRKWVNKGK